MNYEEKRNILFLDSNEKAILQICAFFSKLSCSHNKLAHLYGVDSFFQTKKTTLKRILFPIMKTRLSLIQNVKESIMYFVGMIYIFLRKKIFKVIQNEREVKK